MIFRVWLIIGFFLPFFVVLRGKSFFIRSTRILFYWIVDFLRFSWEELSLPSSLFSENLSLWGRWEFFFTRRLIFSVCGWRKVCLVIEALFLPFLLWKSLFIRSTMILSSWMTFCIRKEQSVFSQSVFSIPPFQLSEFSFIRSIGIFWINFLQRKIFGYFTITDNTLDNGKWIGKIELIRWTLRTNLYHLRWS